METTVKEPKKSSSKINVTSSKKYLLPCKCLSTNCNR